MNVNFILFIRGAAGNFLSRVLTLDSQTVPLGKGDYHVLDTAQRFAQYTYSNYPTLPIPKNDLTTWWNFELENAYPFRRLGIEKLIDLNLKIIEPTHPEYFNHLLTLVDSNDQCQYFYVDITDAEDWVARQKLHKTGDNGHHLVYVYNKIKQETDIITQLKKVYTLQPIFLKDIIHSTESFASEYQRICNLMEIASQLDYALQLRQQWMLTWG